MDTRPIKPKEYFDKILRVAEKDIDYSENPPTVESDWENAECLLPVTKEEFKAIERFIQDRRIHNANSDNNSPRSE